MRFFFVYEKEKLSHIIIWRSFSDEVHGEKDIKIGKLFTAKSLTCNLIQQYPYFSPQKRQHKH